MQKIALQQNTEEDRKKLIEIILKNSLNEVLAHNK